MKCCILSGYLLSVKVNNLRTKEYNDVASDVGVNLCNVKSCLTRQTMRFSQIREAIFLALIFLSTHAQL